MRFSLYLFLFSALLTHLHAAEYGHLTFVTENEPPTIILNDGDILEVLSIAATRTQDSLTWVDVITDDGDVLVHATLYMDFNRRAVHYPNVIGKIVGSCTVRLRGQGSSRLSYKLTRRPDPQAVNTPTAN